MDLTRARRRAAWLAIALAALGAAGCAAQTAPTPRPALTLPASDERLRDGAVAATSWVDMGSGPIGFNADASFRQPRDASAALIEALTAHTGSIYETAGLVGGEDRELLLVSETGEGDDSVAGLQYLVLLELDGREWRIEEMWTRALCRRGVVQDVCV
jgi:hypothetical protein